MTNISTDQGMIDEKADYQASLFWLRHIHHHPSALHTCWHNRANTMNKLVILGLYLWACIIILSGIIFSSINF